MSDTDTGAAMTSRTKRRGYARGQEVLVSEGQDLPRQTLERQFHQ